MRSSRTDRRPAAWIFALCFGLAAVGSVAGSESTGEGANIAAGWTASQHDAWQFLLEELEIQELHQHLSAAHRPGDLAIRDVTVIPMAEPGARSHQTVVVAGGKITALGDNAAITIPAGAEVVDGKGLFLLPGLTDMHVHNLGSHSQHLLNLANGVTTVRDLDGFPWLLRMRDAIAQDRLLAPTLYISGTILNRNDFGGYARTVSSEAEARQAVGEQASAGYDFIKVHNNLSFELLKAITSAARQHELDVVGHIPVGVTVAQAVGLGMRTCEHFKGYIIDSTLTLSDEDYVSATRGAAVWNTPTFTTYRTHLRGADAEKLLARTAEMQYVSPRERRQWTAFVDQEPDRVTKLRQNIYPMSRQIFSALRKLEDARFLAGTDSGSYPMMTPGFILHEEVEIFQQLGMTPFEALATATVEPAAAMRRRGTFGVIVPGARADLLLLAANPLADAGNARAIRGVAVRGVWLGEEDIAAMLQALRDVYARSAQRLGRKTVVKGDIDDYLARMKALAAQGFVFRDHDLELAADMCEHLERPRDAAAMRQLKTEPGSRLAFVHFK